MVINSMGQSIYSESTSRSYSEEVFVLPGTIVHLFTRYRRWTLEPKEHSPLTAPIFKMHFNAIFASTLDYTGRNHSVRIDNSTFERVEEFKYLRTTLTNHNSTAEEIKSRLRSGSTCYHSVQNLLSSRLLSKNLKIKIYRTIIFLILYGCETWPLALREERKLRVFENMVLRRIFGPRRDEVTGEWRLHNEELNDLYSSPNIVRVIKSRSTRWAGHVARMG